MDLCPIKPIPGVITFQDDITTERCRQNLRQEMKTWKADVYVSLLLFKQQTNQSL